MAVAFPDGRSTLIVSWKEDVSVDQLQWILYTHFKDLANSYQADCVLKKIDSHQILVILTGTNREVLSSIAEKTNITYKDEEIKLHIKIPVDDFFTVSSRVLYEEKEEATEIEDKHDIEQETFEQGKEILTDDKTDEIETQEFKQGEEGGKQMEDEHKDLSQAEMCIEIPVQNDVGQFLQDKKRLLFKIIWGKFNCTAALCTNENKLAVSVSKNTAEHLLATEEPIHPISSFPTGVRYMKILQGGLYIFVCLDDMTKHKVDVVVNSANEYLKHDHGRSRTLARAAGPEFVTESVNIVQEHGAVPVGSAVVTGAGKLPCKMVIHAVGPIWNINPHSENDRLLSYAIRNSLVLANELQMTSIAIPAVGFENGFPLQRCVELIVSTVKTFHGIWMPKNALKEIHLVDFSERTTTAMEDACKNILGETSQKHLLSIDFMPNRIRDMYRFQNLHIEIRREKIEEQNTDVIVNTVFRDLNLNSGTVSQAVAEIAGPELQKELHRIKKTELLSYGEVLKTPGFNLSCEYVYHVVFYPQVYFGMENLLKKIAARFFELARADNIRSIAIPVTASALHTIKPNKLARLFIEQLINYVELNEDFRFTTVHFVLHPAESTIYEAFLQELCRVKYLTAQRSGPTPFSVHVDAMTFSLEEEERTEILIKVCGKDYSFLECAQFWINDFILTSQEQLIIENKSINYFTVAENEVIMDLQTKNQIKMHKIVNEIGTFIELGGPHFQILEVALHIESLLCDLQEEMVQALEAEHLQFLVQWVYIREGERYRYGPTESLTLEKAFLNKTVFASFEVDGTQHAICLDRFMALNDQREEFKVERLLQGQDYLTKLPSNWELPDSLTFRKISMDIKGPEFLNLTNYLADVGLNVLKVEKIENPVLWNCHSLKKELDTSAPKIDSQISTLYQRVPEQFCNYICRIGFQEMYSRDYSRRFGDGIYFINDLGHLMKEIADVGKIIHIFEAEVYTGNCCKIPTSHVSLNQRDYDCYEYSENTMDSVHPFKTYVIYNGVLAYPKYLIACRRRLSM
ncbi:protein mono-ADP-ribosyltransferase PARP9 isoform X2 [Scyliorhinus canicula]|uniref:protein mono-ADP-ribosyltransferase PARP9 isoform X2 n=1 Tax=Scyliorhinus canicula TaxID=7830 RepID=UPI0018F3395A|nr:protein mono-ADP-ribosyltransferase PARP9 isoform X2 [Scyliorhinus canicula]